MGILSYLADKFGTKTTAPALAQRSSGYFAAEYSRITSSLVNEARHINEIIRWQGYTLLSRSRQLADNNPYTVKFLQMVVNNVAGPNPFQLQGRIITTRSGKADKVGNDMIEAAWSSWSRARNCDRYGRHSLADIIRLALRIVARDGECLIRLHEGKKAGAYGLQLQIIDTDRLDFNHNETLSNGGVIHAGVELDADGRTVAYWIRKQRPADWQIGNRFRAEYERIPADQMLHLFVALSAEQVRGVPWIYASLMNLHQLNAFEEAAIIAARVGAAKMGFFTRTDPAAEFAGEKDETGAKITDAEPGSFEELPAGLDFKTWDPAYPEAQVGPFMKSCLRGVAAGLGVSYHTLGNDLEAVNFSSARAGVLEEREYWMMLQNWFVDHFMTEIYERWIAMASMTGAVALSGGLDKYKAVYFQPRRWSWVDPLKDVNASIKAIRWGLKSRTAVIAEQGLDIEDTFAQLAAEADLAREKGLIIEEIQKGGATNAPQNDQASQ